MTNSANKNPRLAVHNGLTRDQYGVWSGDEQAAFDYSDGAAAEKWLRHCFSEATDLSVMSSQLEAGIVDWPSEYHLSYERGNLFRPLDLSSMRRVLEVGCGCGAISRYLGEQGLQVDSLEGDHNRARLAAMRVADLPGVEVSCANFNDIDLPQHGYDAVIFVGVLEYAARFRQSQESASDPFDPESNHRTAIVEILKASRQALDANGVVITAIENRLGLKYLLGVREDHYAMPYEGLYNYPNDSGIRTFDRNDWQDFARQAGFDALEYLYPYPDYKLPRVVVSHDFVQQHRNSVELLQGIQSRDYVAAVSGIEQEQYVRDGLAQSGHLPDFANSFLMVMGSGSTARDKVASDFVHVSGRSRQARYRTVTAKPKGEPVVSKVPLQAPSSPNASDEAVGATFVSQHLEAQAFIDGVPLSRKWLALLRTRSDLVAFIDALKQYHNFLGTQFDTAEKRQGAIDALASNILVDQNEHWHVIDLEWRTDEALSVDFLLFRCLFYFFVDNPDALRAVSDRTDDSTVTELIQNLCRQAGVASCAQWDQWVALEDRFQGAIASSDRSGDIADALARSPSAQRFEARIYWSFEGEPTSDDRMRLASGWQDGGRQTLRFTLPSNLTRFKYLRFDPTESKGYFHLYRISLSGRNSHGDSVSLLSLADGDQIRQAVDLIRIDYASGAERDVYIALDDDPIVHLDVESLIGDDIVGDLVFEVDMDCPRSQDYRVMADRFLGDIDRLESQLEAAQLKLKLVKDAEAELNQIKNSRVWRVADRARYLFYKRGMSRLPKLQNMLLKMSRGGVRQTARDLFKADSDVLTTPADAAVGAAQEVEARHSKYDQWREKNALTEQDRERYRQQIVDLPQKPLISVIMPVYNVDAVWLERAIDSVRNQLYQNWELIIIDDNSDREETVEVLNWLSVPRIHIRRLDKNRNIAGATNEGIRMATGSYIAFLDHDDEMAENALAEVVFAIVERDPDAIYTDEDFVTLDRRHVNPHFKPDYSPDLLLSHNYITHLSVVRRELVERIGGLRSEFDGAQDYDFWLRVTEQTDDVLHIPKVLYHWRMVESSTSLDADAKPAALLASRRALEQSLARRGENAEVLHGNIPYFFRVKREVIDSTDQKVSIIIPFKDKPELLESSIGKICEVSTYKNFEILGISNNSERESTFRTMRDLEQRDGRVRFIEHNEPFNFSELTNVGVSHSNGRYVVLFNNDVEVISWDWLECLIEHAQRPDVGVVGGKLFYPDNTVQHAGIIIGIGDYAGHPHKHFNSRRSGYFNRASVQQNISAVTGAFMMFRREVFDAAGGFDQEAFKVACNDVDFCLKVRALGLLNVFTPYAQAYHHESVSRGYEDTPAKKARFETEKSEFQRRHHRLLESGDPYYNPNFALDNEHFGIRV